MILKRPTVVVSNSTPADKYLAVATFVPIAHWRHVLGSFRLSNRVEQQLKKTPGVIAYSLAVDLPRRHFWTLTVWSDPAAVAAFTSSEPHATAVEKFKTWAGKGAAFVNWETADAALNWKDAFSHLQGRASYNDRPT